MLCAPVASFVCIVRAVHQNYPKDKEFPDKKSGGIAAAMLFTLVASVLQTIALSCLFTGLHVATVQAAVTTVSTVSVSLLPPNPAGLVIHRAGLRAVLSCHAQTVSVVFAFTCLSSSIDGAFQKTNRTLMLINQGHHLACCKLRRVLERVHERAGFVRDACCCGRRAESLCLL